MTRFLPLVVFSTAALAQAPNPAADPDANAPAASPAQNRQAKQLPPPGVAIPDADRAELTAGVAELGKEIAALKTSKLAAGMNVLLPDVEIFHKAVDWALRYNEFYNVKEVGAARELLKEGKARAAALREGKAPWTTKNGPVARGYRSKIDGSVQPYGVVVPPTWTGVADKKSRPTWIWNHGRGDTLTELSFITQRQKSAGEFTPEDTLVVHPYGRFCNATKFAGEVDVFESLAAVAAAYPVDQQRVVNAGFSMGGASAWHLGVHFPARWVVSHAGAGFAETAEYAGVFAAGKTPPPWWEQTLWRWYDATVCVANFTRHAAYAYHGSEDKQGQATKIMQRFAEKEGVALEEFVGPGVGHKYEPKTKKDVLAKIQETTAKGIEAFPRTFRYVTYSLIYPQSSPIRLEQLGQSWQRAEVKYTLSPQGELNITTGNVRAFRLLNPASANPKITKLIIDQQPLAAPTSSTAAFVKPEQQWKAATEQDLAGRKNPETCGPIDHAFLSAFVFVKPTGKPLTPALGTWAQRELDHATKQWRAIYRGEAPSVDDTSVTAEQFKDSHLVLWGDPSSNAVLKKIADKLPVKWTATGVEFGGKTYPATHAPLLIFPNPLNPHKYVVLNSGFTFNRAAASGTNSQQTPKLPDWAIVDTTVPPDDKFPGKIVDAGFFDELWKFTTERPK